MAKYALVFQGQVIQIEDEPFPVAPQMVWVKTAKKIETGYLYDNGKFIEPPAIIIPPVIKKDDEFRIATKNIIKALTAFVSGDISKETLSEIYNKNKAVIETINE